MSRLSYDPLGRRVEKVAGAVTRSYVYDGEDILRETSSSGTVLTYVHGPGIDEPLASEDAGSVRTYLHPDGLGSIVKTTNASGAAGSTFKYNAFGVIETGTPSTYAYTGRQWDSEAGLYYYRARYYDPKIGRFISEDPLPLAMPGSRRGSLVDRVLPVVTHAEPFPSVKRIQQLVQRGLAIDDDINHYTYVGDNPASYVDPSGQSEIPATAFELLHLYHMAKCTKEDADCKKEIVKQWPCGPWQQTCLFNGYDCCNSAWLNCVTFKLLGSPGPCF